MNKNNVKNKEAKNLLTMAVLAGNIMLKNGAETYRVEDTITRICKSRLNTESVEPFVTPTGMFVSIQCNGEIISYVQRVKDIKINLDKINMVNDFSRKFVSSNMPIDKGYTELKKIDSIPSYKNIIKIVFGSLAGAFFTMLYGGTIKDFIGTFLVNILVIWSNIFLSKSGINSFISSFLGALLASFLSILVIKIGIGDSMDRIIIGAIMSLVPGVAITNAIRDSFSGDFISGLSRGAEALIIALAIAFGVGIVLKIHISI